MKFIDPHVYVNLKMDKVCGMLYLELFFPY